MTSVAIAQNIQEDPVEIFTVEQIQDLIPHRYPMLFVERLEIIEPGVRAIGTKCVSINEPFFQGHFPDAPVMPGVLVVEALAQTAGALVTHAVREQQGGKNTVYFLSIDNARFRKPVTPGDQLKLVVEKVHSRGTVWKFKGKAMVEGKVYAEALFTAMISKKVES
ncbi:MAG: 3-hydroxyacyl-ACP dehydratase FabZ [bacterium]|nr:3-hydroxyacyl-ACP dehydratase FabZ [bacterium]